MRLIYTNVISITGPQYPQYRRVLCYRDGVPIGCIYELDFNSLTAKTIVTDFRKGTSKSKRVKLDEVVVVLEPNMRHLAPLVHPNCRIEFVS